MQDNNNTVKPQKLDVFNFELSVGLDRVWPQKCQITIP